MKPTEIVNTDDTFPQGDTLENLQCYVSTELGKYWWSFFNVEEDIYSWYKKDFHLRVDFWNKVAYLYNTETHEGELITIQIISWKLFANQLENLLSNDSIKLTN